MSHEASSIIDPTAIIGKNVSIGSFCVIGKNVEIQDGTVIEPHVLIKKDTKIGKNNYVHSFAAIGGSPQFLNFNESDNVALEIGDNNIIREFCTISRGSVEGGGKTIIGNNNYFMAYSHVAHDCNVGDRNIFINNASIAGHVKVYDNVILGAFTGVHQFCHIWSYSFLSRACKINQDIPPYMMVVGNPGGPCGINKIGLQRNGFTSEQIRNIRKAYNILYCRNLSLSEASRIIFELAEDNHELVLLIEALKNKNRGIARPKTKRINGIEDEK